MTFGWTAEGAIPTQMSVSECVSEQGPGLVPDMLPFQNVSLVITLVRDVHLFSNHTLKEYSSVFYKLLLTIKYIDQRQHLIFRDSLLLTTQ